MPTIELIRERCTYCGMGTADPWLHHERYAHLPYVDRDGVLHGFSYESGTFRPVTCPDCTQLGYGCDRHRNEAQTR